MKTTVKIALTTGTLCMVTAFAGCGSKFSESPADSVKIKGVTLEERLNHKNKIDSRIQEVQQGADKAKKILTMFRQVQDPNSAADVYTPIDFLLDANTELKEKMPENRGERLVRFGQVQLPVATLPAECKVVSTMLESSVIFDKASSEKTPIGERLTYSLKSCGTEEKYAEVAVAEWIGSDLEFRIVNKNLQSIFVHLLKKDFESNSACKVTHGAKNILETLSCQNFDLRLSGSENATISKMVFNNSGDIRFESLADIFENGKLKAKSHITILSNGDKRFDLQKVDATGAPEAASNAAPDAAAAATADNQK